MARGSGSGAPSSVEAENGALRFKVSDPSPLTTQQLLRENFWLRELLESQLSAIREHIDSSDKAVELLQAFADRTPTTKDVQHEVTALREVVMEMFEGVKNTFLQNATALTAALQAQEKQAIATTDNTTTANNKMEAAFTKQIDNIGETRKSDMKGVDDKLDAVKERITIIEGRTSVSDPSTAVTLAKLEASIINLRSTSDTSGGKSMGAAALWGLIGGGLGLLFGLGAFVAVLMRMGGAN